MKTVRRSQLIPHPLNPRHIDAHARKKLRESLKSSGLVEPLCWNVRTGHVVGGHQRLALLDEEAGGEDYLLDVAVVDLPPEKERVLLVRLNNQSLMGEFDLGILDQLARDAEVPLDLSDLGFDALDLQVMFPDLATPQSAPSPKRTAGVPGSAPSAAGPGGEAAGDGEEEDGDEETDAARPGLFDKANDQGQASIDQLKALKKQKKEEARKEDLAGYYVTAVFGDDDECARFLKALGMPEGERFIDGRRLATAAGIDLDLVN